MFRFDENRLVVYPGYSWDGASGPAVDTRSSMARSLMHDCAYQSIRMERLNRDYRKAADSDFRELLRSEGMGRVWSLRQVLGPARLRRLRRETVALRAVCFGKTGHSVGVPCQLRLPERAA